MLTVINIEQTPNPNALKFVVNDSFVPNGSVTYNNPKEAGADPLGQSLFRIRGVRSVFYMNDFVTVTKSDAGQEWHHLKPMILGAIMDHFSLGRPVMLEGGVSASGHSAGAAGASGDDEEIIAQIIELLDTKVRPAVAQDGGDIVFRGYENGIVSVHLQGSCAGCPSSTMTLKNGIENMLKHYIPEVEEVRQVG